MSAKEEEARKHAVAQAAVRTLADSMRARRAARSERRQVKSEDGTLTSPGPATGTGADAVVGSTLDDAAGVRPQFNPQLKQEAPVSSLNDGARAGSLADAAMRWRRPPPSVALEFDPRAHHIFSSSDGEGIDGGATSRGDPSGATVTATSADAPVAAYYRVDVDGGADDRGGGVSLGFSEGEGPSLRRHRSPDSTASVKAPGIVLQRGDPISEPMPRDGTLLTPSGRRGSDGDSGLEHRVHYGSRTCTSPLLSSHRPEIPIPAQQAQPTAITPARTEQAPHDSAALTPGRRCATSNSHSSEPKQLPSELPDVEQGTASGPAHPIAPALDATDNAEAIHTFPVAARPDCFGPQPPAVATRCPAPVPAIPDGLADSASEAPTESLPRTSRLPGSPRTLPAPQADFPASRRRSHLLPEAAAVLTPRARIPEPAAAATDVNDKGDEPIAASHDSSRPGALSSPRELATAVPEAHARMRPSTVPARGTGSARSTASLHVTEHAAPRPTQLSPARDTALFASSALAAPAPMGASDAVPTYASELLETPAAQQSGLADPRGARLAALARQQQQMLHQRKLVTAWGDPSVLYRGAPVSFTAPLPGQDSSATTDDEGTPYCAPTLRRVGTAATALRTERGLPSASAQQQRLAASFGAVPGGMLLSTWGVPQSGDRVPSPALIGRIVSATSLHQPRRVQTAAVGLRSSEHTSVSAGGGRDSTEPAAGCAVREEQP